MPGLQDQAGEPLITDSPANSSTEPAQPPQPASDTRRRGLFVLLVVVAVVTFVADQLSKLWAIRELTGQDPRDLLGSFLRLDLVRNPGAAFSLGTGSTWLLTLIAVVVLVVVIRTSRRLGSRGWAWAFGLLLGGALGNLVDRLFREPGFGQGHVVDFIDYHGLFIGNVADVAIVSAAVLIALLAVLGIGVDGSRSGRSADGAREADPSTPYQPRHEAAGDVGAEASTDGPDEAPDGSRP